MKTSIFILLLIFSLFIQQSYAVDIAPHISDREIIESLAELKVGQKIIHEKFKSIDKRFDFISNLMLVMLAGIFGLIGFIVWDRKTALRPLEKRTEAFERDVQHDLELRHDKGSLLTRLVKSLQELAKHDEKVAIVLRSFTRCYKKLMVY